MFSCPFPSMKSFPLWVRFFWMGLAAAPAAVAQNVFLATEDHQPPRVVKGVSLERPLVEVDGKIQVSTASNYTFGHALVYRPGLITLSNFRVRSHHLTNSSGRFNYELEIFGDATSDVELKDCFLVLEINAWKNAGCVWKELRDLAPGKSVQLNHTFQLNTPLEEGSYRLHVFSGGLEVLHSRMTGDYRTAQQEKTKALLAGTKQDFSPILAQRAPTVYPPELKAKKLEGFAQVKCLVSANGEVTSAELVSATEPAFGVAALATVPKWKFDPAVKARHFVEGESIVTVDFAAPK
jgi:TonB family protein